MAPFKDILVHVNSQADSHPAVDCAVELARKDKARLTLLDVVPEMPWSARLVFGSDDRVVKDIAHAKSQSLAELATRLERDGLEVSTKLVDAPSSVGIIREVLSEGHDLVIRTAKGAASRRLGFFGTTATRLLRKCPCPVLILNPEGSGRIEKVVAAVNAASDDELHENLNAEILRLASALSRDRLQAVSVWEVYGESILKEHMKIEEFEALSKRTQTHAKQQLEALVKPFALSGENVQLLHGDPGDAIPRFLRDHQADLLVMGTIGRRGIAGLLIGNTAEQILDRVECSVLAVKPKGFVSPIKPLSVEAASQSEG